TIPNSERQQQGFHLQSEMRWTPMLLFIGIIGVSLFLLLAPREHARPPADQPKTAVVQRAPKEAAPSGDVQRPSSFSSAAPPSFLEQSLPSPAPRDDWMAGRHANSPAQPVEPPRRSWELDTLLAKLKNAKAVTPETAKDMKQQLRELRKQGVAAV